MLLSHLQCKCFIGDRFVLVPSVITYGGFGQFYSYVCICMLCSRRCHFTFSIKHLWDVQELFSHLKGSVQVTNGVILQRDRLM